MNEKKLAKILFTLVNLFGEEKAIEIFKKLIRILFD